MGRGREGVGEGVGEGGGEGRREEGEGEGNSWKGKLEICCFKLLLFKFIYEFG